jgi:two-component system response regulator
MDTRPILLVEDNPDDIELTLRALKKNRISNEVVIAKDGVEALEFLFNDGVFRKKTGYDMPALLLLDLKLPAMDGFEILRRVRAFDRTKLIPVVILTSSREKLDLLKGYQLGANSYVRKPTDFSEFLQTIQELGQYWLTLNEPVPNGGGS